MLLFLLLVCIVLWNHFHLGPSPDWLPLLLLLGFLDLGCTIWGRIRGRGLFDDVGDENPLVDAVLLLLDQVQRRVCFSEFQRGLLHYTNIFGACCASRFSGGRKLLRGYQEGLAWLLDQGLIHFYWGIRDVPIYTHCGIIGYRVCFHGFLLYFSCTWVNCFYILTCYIHLRFHSQVLCHIKGVVGWGLVRICLQVGLPSHFPLQIRGIWVHENALAILDISHLFLNFVFY